MSQTSMILRNKEEAWDFTVVETLNEELSLTHSIFEDRSQGLRGLSEESLQLKNALCLQWPNSNEK